MLVKTINKQNRKNALQILTTAFAKNPNINLVARNPSKIKGVCAYCLDSAILKNGAFITADEKGVLLCYPSQAPFSFLQKIQYGFIYLKFLLFSFRLSGLFQTLAQQRHLKEQLPKQNYLYCLILAVDKDRTSLQTTASLRDFLFNKSQQLKLPIYAQTSVRRNNILFQRYGFKNYHTFQQPHADFTIWVLKKEYHDPNNKNT